MQKDKRKPMRKVCVVLLCVCYGATPSYVGAQWAVVDAGNIVQNVIQATNSVRQVAQQAQQLVNDATKIYNQYQQIQHAYTQVQHGIRNLQQFNLNYAADILQLAGKIDQKLAQAQQIGYQANTVAGQLTKTYNNISQVATWEEGNMVRRRWVSAARETSQVAGQVQAIQEQLRQSSKQVSDLAAKMAGTTGNLDTLQAIGQGQQLTNQQLLAIEQQLAVQGRLAVLEAQEKAAREQLALDFEQRYLPPTPSPAYDGQFRVLHIATP